MGKAFAPKEARREDQGSYITVQTPSGPKLMRAGDAARAGYVPLSAEPNAKPSTGEQKQALAFFNRGKEAVGILDAKDKNDMTLEDRIASVNPAAGAFGQRAPNFLKGRDRQVYEQAQRAFTQAKLRKESGAAISAAEYESDAQTYFAQPGDAPDVVANKKAARQGVLEGLKFQAGPAYREFYGESAPSAPGAAASRARPPLESFMRP
jgi:hypothetical protein